MAIGYETPDLNFVAKPSPKAKMGEGERMSNLRLLKRIMESRRRTTPSVKGSITKEQLASQITKARKMLGWDK